MSPPLVRSRVPCTTNVSSASQVVSLPGTIEAGDLLIVATLVISNWSGISTPSGWTRFAYVDPGSGGHGLAFYSKVADGTEDWGTVTFTLSTARAIAYASWAISGADTAVTPEYVSGYESGVTNPNPPAITPSWSLAEDLFIVTCSGSTNPTAAPSGYTSFSRTTTGVQAGVAERGALTAVEDPGEFTGASANYRTSVIAIKGPAPAAGLFFGSIF